MFVCSSIDRCEFRHPRIALNQSDRKLERSPLLSCHLKAKEKRTGMHLGIEQ
jgi:hypothetical protein